MFSGGFNPGHWIIVLVIVLIIFGTKKLRNIGQDMGAAVKGFKDGMKGPEETPQAAQSTAQVAQNESAHAKDPNTIDVNSKEVR